jgi:hypothetical protein
LLFISLKSNYSKPNAPLQSRGNKIGILFIISTNPFQKVAGVELAAGVKAAFAGNSCD